MESAGLLEAIHDKSPTTAAIVVRGISDLADEQKSKLDELDTDALRGYAMANAVELLFTLMATSPLNDR